MATMRWFRSQARWHSLLALCALSLQLALSFGHVHIGAASSVWRLAQLAQPITAHRAVAMPDEPTVPGPPVRLGDDFCAICSVIQQVASAAPIAAPSLPVLALIGGHPLDAEIDLASAASPHASYLARAPPFA
jgi:hypothetical protein